MDGMDGERGPAGPPGADGIDGRDGANGRDGERGSDGLTPPHAIRVVVQYDERRGVISGFEQHLSDGTIRTLNVKRSETGRPITLE